MDDLDQIEELTPEQEAADDAAFEAAFNNARGITEPVVETASEAAEPEAPAGEEAEPTAEEQAAQAAQAQADEEAAAVAAAEADANAPVAVSRAELDALRAVAGTVSALQEELRRTTDTVNGKFGSLKQTIEAVKAQAQQGVKPTLNQLKRLDAEYPELAAMLREDLEEAFGAGNATQAPAPAEEQQQVDDKASGENPGAAHQPADVDPLADPRVQQVLLQKELAIVDLKHPDWRDLTQTPEFNDWKNGLPAEAQTLLATTRKADVLADAIADFKGWKAKRSAAADANKQRGKRLENAIPATTGKPTGAHAIDDDTAFLQGHQSVRSGRR